MKTRQNPEQTKIICKLNLFRQVLKMVSDHFMRYHEKVLSCQTFFDSCPKTATKTECKFDTWGQIVPRSTLPPVLSAAIERQPKQNRSISSGQMHKPRSTMAVILRENWTRVRLLENIEPEFDSRVGQKSEVGAYKNFSWVRTKMRTKASGNVKSQ